MERQIETKKNELIISGHLPEILKIIDENLVSQINAPTGSGKSIGIIKALAETGKRVFSSVPTRVSATSLSSYLKTLNPELSVGYAAEGNAMYNDNTQVVYATSGHVRRKLLGYFSRGLERSRMGLMFTDILILDETHSGSLDNTIIFSLWMEALRMKVKVPRLVLLSATPTDLPVEPKPIVYSVPVPTPFPVEIIYDAPDSEDETNDYAVDSAISLYHDNHVEGDILIFVPGSRDVDEMIGKLQEALPEAVILPAYSTLDSDDLKKIYTPTKERKIIVATNIAESSITIDGLTVVIDTLFCKEATASSSGATRLETVRVTKDSAKQRAGRVGRTCPGKCYRLMNESDYEELEDHRRPEVERIPLHNTVMEFFQANIDPVNVIRGIDSSKVKESIELLTRLGMLVNESKIRPPGDEHLLEKKEEENEEEKFIVTRAGNFAPSVPLGVRNAAFLWRWMEAKLPLYPGVVIATIIDVHSNGYFYIPRKKRNQSPFEYNVFCSEYIKTRFGTWIGDTPLHTYLNMWNAFTKNLGRNHFRVVSEPWSYNYRRWSKDHSMNYRQLSEMITVLSQTYRNIRSSRRRTDVNVEFFDVKEMIDKATPMLQDIYQDVAIGRSWMGDMHHPITGYKYTYDNRRIISTMEMTQPERVVPLATHEIVTRGGRIMGFIDLFLPFPLPKEEETEDSNLD
ncbi:ATP-dependent helicase [uncultured virus]|nr:ATP-dependent helicase [uncultured virus]